MQTFRQTGDRIQPEQKARAQADTPEAGFMLVFVILLVALVLIGLAVAAPIVAKDLQRDKEVETEHRGEQYVRAIRLYYRKNGAYPPSMDALANTNNVRYLRKQYIDPLTGKSDWRIIHVGENKTTVKGFFGQPLGGINGAGLGSASSLGSGFGGSSSPTAGTTSTIGGTSALSAGFLGASDTSDSTTTSAFGTGTGTPGSTGTNGTGGTGSNSGTGSSSSSSGLGSGAIGQIMGVGVPKDANSILTPNQQTTYQTWEFIYDPRIEQLYAGSSLLGGGISSGSATGSNSLNGQSGQSNSTNSTNSPFGSSSFGSSSFGSSSFGSSNSNNSTTNSPSTTTPSTPSSNPP